MLRYFKLAWPETPVPQGEPGHILYEIDDTRDVVLRLIDVYQDGRLLKESVTKFDRDDLDLRNPADRSLLHGAVLDDGFSAAMKEISAAEFAETWGLAHWA